MFKIWFIYPYIVIGIQIKMKICKGNRNEVYVWRDDLRG